MAPNCSAQFLVSTERDKPYSKLMLSGPSQHNNININATNKYLLMNFIPPELNHKTH